MRRNAKKKTLRAAAAVLAAVVLLLLPSCETMPEQTASSAGSVSAVSDAPDGGGQADGGVMPEPVPDGGEGESRELTYRVEEYSLREDNLEFSVTYPQIEGTLYEEVNDLLREKGMETVDLLLLEEERRAEALAALSSAPPEESEAQSGDSGGSEAAAASSSAAQEPAAGLQDRYLTLMGGSTCFLPSADFVSVSFTMDITDSSQAYPSREWYTFNYDLRRGEEVTCADLFADLDGLADALREQVEEDGLDESLLAYLTRDRLRAGLPGVPVAFGTGFAEFGFPVPRSAGDVLLISLPLRRASAFRSDNTLWEVIGTS